MADMIKQGVKLGFGVCVVASFIGYTVEFGYDQHNNYRHRGKVGFIFLWLFILLFSVLGVVAAISENPMMAGAYVILYSVCVLCDGLYVGHRYAWDIGVAVCSLGCAFCVSVAGGGGGGGK
ncbi:hypothetical protein RDWZM_006468 [Blomia tropicalis]|uniref:Uncharacterized protein n=1 Tax=Blomia tropicalis TaxID=40697 RepID=A0A9Q0RNF0_BLOTA|nr:hypothetical protein BLOT_008588 [Blomia tropicalis]KAJ6220656.1 hypothetical protein RDWZM_006468 [Blomia tropicalis]